MIFNIEINTGQRKNLCPVFKCLKNYIIDFMHNVSQNNGNNGIGLDIMKNIYDF
ncbi:hypothetical protein [Clostridium sp. C2-6-12]|uniref:hypothetical protein n=1 Tax=Clostridium sp. C2-6-12 TaxID=2698832 RepID=UPI00136C6DC8|nr:hypothetical protein [Clostridium sp. C2-6-12]